MPSRRIRDFLFALTTITGLAIVSNLLEGDEFTGATLIAIGLGGATADQLVRRRRRVKR
jgi:hypothetical protein